MVLKNTKWDTFSAPSGCLDLGSFICACPSAKCVINFFERVEKSRYQPTKGQRPTQLFSKKSSCLPTKGQPKLNFFSVKHQIPADARSASNSIFFLKNPTPCRYQPTKSQPKLNFFCKNPDTSRRNISVQLNYF